MLTLGAKKADRIHIGGSVLTIEGINRNQQTAKISLTEPTLEAIIGLNEPFKVGNVILILKKIDYRGQISIGINAPKEVRILRQKVLDKMGG